MQIFCSELKLSDQEHALKLLQVELSALRSEHSAMQNAASGRANEIEHVRMQHNAALEEVIQMKKLHAVFQHDMMCVFPHGIRDGFGCYFVYSRPLGLYSTTTTLSLVSTPTHPHCSMHRQLENAWQRERDTLTAQNAQLVAAAAEHERGVVKLVDRVNALERENEAQTDETRRAQVRSLRSRSIEQYLQPVSGILDTGFCVASSPWSHRIVMSTRFISFLITHHSLSLSSSPTHPRARHRPCSKRWLPTCTTA